VPKNTTTKPSRTLGQRILAARQRAGLSITEVARRAEVSYGTVWNWEADRCVPAKSSAAFARVASTIPLPKVALGQLR
jgi:DNA-binding transcriptional regulator YiaG